MRRRLLGLLLLLPALAGCGQASTDVARPAAEPRPAAESGDAGWAEERPLRDPAAVPAGAPAAAAAARSVTYAAVTEGGLDGEPTAVEARTSGVPDTTADAGTAALGLVALDDLAAVVAADGQPAGEPAALAHLQRWPTCSAGPPAAGLDRDRAHGRRRGRADDRRARPHGHVGDRQGAVRAGRAVGRHRRCDGRGP